MSLIRVWVPRLGSGADPALHRIKFPFFWMRDPGVVGSYKAEVGQVVSTICGSITSYSDVMSVSGGRLRTR